MDCVTTMKITDKKQLMKLISFMVMGDGSVYRSRGAGNCIFSMSMVEKHRDFLEYCKSVIENVTSCKMIEESRVSPRQNQIKIYTPVHPYFNTLRDRIYYDNYKSIDPHALELLDYESLAILYMCDGCLGKFINKDSRVTYTTTINLCRLSYGDMLLLKKGIKDKLDLEFNIVKTNTKYLTLRLRMKDFDKFMNGIEPFIFESFRYKLYIRTIDPSLEEGGDIV